MLSYLQKALRELFQLKDVKQAYRDLFNSPLGRVVLLDLIKIHCCTPSFTESPDQLRFKEGKRAVVLQIAHTIFSPDDFASQILTLTQQIEEERKGNE